MITAYKFKFGSRGFTLIELMITISIIAILAVIGLTLFGNVQKSGRDARRKADIDAISKSLEVDYSNNNRAQYQALVDTMFAGGKVPTDPLPAPYVQYTTTALPAAGFTTCADLELPTGGNSSDINGTAATNGGFYCRKNQQ